MSKDLIMIEDHQFPMMHRIVKAGSLMPGVADKYADMLINNGIAREDTQLDKQARNLAAAAKSLPAKLAEKIFGKSSKDDTEAVATKDSGGGKVLRQTVPTKDNPKP